MTKKEILDWIEEKNILFKNGSNQYGDGYLDALDIIKDKIQQLPDDEWIPFSERMPSEEDYVKVNNDKSILGANLEEITLLTNTLNIDIMSQRFTHWKRITLPTKTLPTKAEILEKLGLSEEELKEIIK